MATKARYLKKFWIDWATPHVDYNPGQSRGLSRGEVVLGVNKKIQAFGPLTDLISAELRRARRHLSPEITHAQVSISNVSSVDFAMYPIRKGDSLGIYSQYWMDPLEILDVPEDDGSLAKLGICIVEEFLETMAYQNDFLSGFPRDVFETAISKYRENGMAVAYPPTKTSIEGTSIKAIFHAEESPSETAIWVTFKKNRTPLFSKIISRERPGNGAVAFYFPQVVISGTALEVHGVELTPKAAIRIEFAELPSNFIELLEADSDS